MSKVEIRQVGPCPERDQAPLDAALPTHRYCTAQDKAVLLTKVGPHVPAMTGAFVRDNLIARFAGQPLLTSVL